MVMSVHIALEGLIARFNVTEIPNIEKPNSVDGVSEYPKYYSGDLIEINTCLCRSWRFQLLSISTSAHPIPGSDTSCKQ